MGSFIEWDDALLIGIPEIDDQHKEFFRLLQRAYDSTSDGVVMEDEGEYEVING